VLAGAVLDVLVRFEGAARLLDHGFGNGNLAALLVDQGAGVAVGRHGGILRGTGLAHLSSLLGAGFHSLFNLDEILMTTSADGHGTASRSDLSGIRTGRRYPRRPSAGTCCRPER